jgi:hypothetical protein
VKFQTRPFAGAVPFQPSIPRCQAEVLDGSKLRQCKRDARFGTPPDIAGAPIWCRQHSEIDRFKKGLFK